ncbi:Hypothetical protein NGAL_HAMBI2605_64390 [Neorhizobium galegae bv. orientalis]|nr:Hypothetical protein NGAL_HAMBI2605_64390 [Neorhizobium galegae bv. orientalis]
MTGHNELTDGNNTEPLPGRDPAAKRTDDPKPKASDFGLDDRKESVKTYIEQTKLLVTLASAFVVAPTALVSVVKDRLAVPLSSEQLFTFVAAEILFILSVLLGYVVLGTLAGSQVRGEYWVYRNATMRSSLFQIGFYLAGLLAFMVFAYRIIAVPSPPPAGAVLSSAPTMQPPRFDAAGASGAERSQ